MVAKGKRKGQPPFVVVFVGGEGSPPKKAKYIVHVDVHSRHRLAKFKTTKEGGVFVGLRLNRDLSEKERRHVPAGGPSVFYPLVPRGGDHELKRETRRELLGFLPAKWAESKSPWPCSGDPPPQWILVFLAVSLFIPR